ncbi:MAG TPA: response regulator transcription factor [Candidatus Limnocylindria bacterium]|nr:response regulator transcription factor [Candidatus Limnocylindria bacterium]
MIRRNGQQSADQGAASFARATPAPPIAPTPVRVALLSDSALFRSGLHRLLGTDPSFVVVAELTAPPVRERLRRSVPQVLLVDAQVEGALEVCRELRLTRVRPWVILAGVDRDERWAVEALRTGARGILPKSATVEHLLKAIRVVHQGEVWASKRVIALTVEELAARSVNPGVGQLALRERLSAREQEIVHLIVGGLSNLEAANRLGITEATVKAHLTRVFQKLALRDRAQLAARYHGSVEAAAGPGRAPLDA